jgi:hypothetical protein
MSEFRSIMCKGGHNRDKEQSRTATIAAIRHATGGIIARLPSAQPSRATGLNRESTKRIL